MEWIENWFARRGWKPFPFQLEAYQAGIQRKSGLIHAPTGVGKTLAAWLTYAGSSRISIDLVPTQADATSAPVGSRKASRARKTPSLPCPPLTLLWITPLRALAEDTVRALDAFASDMGYHWRVEGRTGDTSGAQKAKQRKSLPTLLVTTPESLSLLLSYRESQQMFSSVSHVIVDEWHELMGTKRGVQTELGLARLRNWNPGIATWGLSATLGNLAEAMETLLGAQENAGKLITGAIPKEIQLETLLPEVMDHFPWGGHLGIKLLPQVLTAIEKSESTLVFTHVRSQTEIWYQAILEARPEWKDLIGIHHGSIDRKERERIEGGLREGKFKAVVCTSSLDLGVDFTPVDQVIQIGGPKGVARLLQRAGRSGHQPGRASRIIGVPTHALELLEYAAVREVMARGEIEPRPPLKAPLDLLAQHVVTVGLGGGFTRDALYAEILTTQAYRSLSRDHFDWVLQFVMHGGKSLNAYPEFHRVVENNGRCEVPSDLIGRFHRMNIGTITSDAAVEIRFLNGARLGSVEESFIARLKPGQHFRFGGRVLKLIRVHQMTAHVRAATRSSGTVPQWEGGSSRLSSLLGEEVCRILEKVHKDGAAFFENPRLARELKAIEPILNLQQRWSRIPDQSELLIETTTTREGKHWFVYPFAGRTLHEGLAALLAYRLSRRQPITVTVAVNDYGLELLPQQPLEISEHEWHELLSVTNWSEDLVGCLNSTELAKRQFREVARVAGLVFQGYPGAHKTMRQVQASSGLFFDVFQQYESDHLLLEQARREVLEHQLDASRLHQVLRSINSKQIRMTSPEKLSPLGFPLWAEMIRGQVTSETWKDRVLRMVAELESNLAP